MLMPAGHEFNGAKDVLQFKLIQAAKEKHKFHNNINDNNFDKVVMKNANRMDVDEEGVNVRHVNKNALKEKLVDVDNNNDNNFRRRRNSDSKGSFVVKKRIIENSDDDDDPNSKGFVPNIRISSCRKTKELLPVSRNKQFSKASRTSKPSNRAKYL